MSAILNALSRAVLVWLVLMAAESLQGEARHLLLSPALERALHQLSVIIGLIIIFAITWVLLPWMRIRSSRQALAIGAMWALLTLLFEFGVGRMTGASWSQILTDYDLTRGGLMPLGLLAMALTPWTIWRLQTRPPRAPPPSQRRQGKSP